MDEAEPNAITLFQPFNLLANVFNKPNAFVAKHASRVQEVFVGSANSGVCYLDESIVGTKQTRCSILHDSAFLRAAEDFE